MDGLTISTGQASAGARPNAEGNPQFRFAEANPPHRRSEGGDKSFADTLKDAVQSVNQAQQESDVKMQEIATGKNHNIPEVMITAEKADISLKLMVQVRNKIIEAYQEIMKMQV